MNYLKPTITAIVLSILTFSCSSDDDSNNEETSSNSFNAPTTITGDISTQILGTWQIVSITEDGRLEVMEECDLQETIIFASNNQYTSIEAETDNEPCRFFTNRGTYNLNDSRVEFSLGGDRFNQTITGLSTTGLVLQENFRENGRTFVFVETYRRVGN